MFANIDIFVVFKAYWYQIIKNLKTNGFKNFKIVESLNLNFKNPLKLILKIPNHKI
jgi:hypothetical protein